MTCRTRHQNVAFEFDPSARRILYLTLPCPPKTPATTARRPGGTHLGIPPSIARNRQPNSKAGTANATYALRKHPPSYHLCAAQSGPKFRRPSPAPVRTLPPQPAGAHLIRLSGGGIGDAQA